jgi:hypothetical protein
MTSDLWQDVRITGRLIGRQPGFFFAVVTALALGIGANAAVFGVANSVLLSPLPFVEPNRLFLLLAETQTGSSTRYSYPDFLDLRSSSRSFRAMAAWRSHGATVSGSGDPEFVEVRQASAGLLGVLGVPMAMGRDFSADEDRPGAGPVAIISHAMWAQRFSRRPDAIGAQITLNGIM